MRVRWLRTALRNLDEAAEWIARDNPKAAGEFVAAVRLTVDRLAEFPAMGRAGRVPGVREMPVQGYPYLIPYRVVGEELQVLRVFHVWQQRPGEWVSE